MTFTIPVSNDFDFEHTVRSYGFYAMAPNMYDKTTHTFSRPLRAFSGEGDSTKVVNIKVTHVPSTTVSFHQHIAHPAC